MWSWEDELKRSAVLFALLGVALLLGTTPAASLAPPSSSPCSNYTLQGTVRSDFLIGTSGRDVIRARAGNDVVLGLGGNDVICGNLGGDRLVGGDGNDSIYCGWGNDEWSGEKVDERCFP